MTLAAGNNLAHAKIDREPTWDIAYLFPEQGNWSEAEYLDLKGNRLIEFSNGIVEVLTMPTMAHQLMMMFVSDLLRAIVNPKKLGIVLLPPFRIRLWEGKYRMPDLMFMRCENAARMGNEAWDGADLVMEIVSEDDRRRDTETKRYEYARAGIPEYWIVDPQKRQVLVLELVGRGYSIVGEFSENSQAQSRLIPEFSVDVAALFAAGAQR